MKTYKEFEELVYNWLIKKHTDDLSFTFSLRQKANKGAQLNYFIGTENSKYFSTTFWYIPVKFPGSSSDLINLYFKIEENSFSYHVKFNHTRDPFDDQNKFALKFIQQLKERLRGFRGFYENDPANKMEYFHVGDSKAKYTEVEDLFKEVEIDLKNLIPIVDSEIVLFKQKHPNFEAHRFTDEQFDSMVEKLKMRKEKYSHTETIATATEPLKALVKELLSDSSKPIYNYPLNQILFGPPGTGKTYNTINEALKIIEPQFYAQNIENRKALTDRFKELLIKDWTNPKGQIVFTTFHQSMSYEDFIEGIKPETIDNEVIYDIKPGVFKLICEQAKAKAISSDNFEQVYHKFLEEIKKNEGKLVLESIVHAKEFTVYENSKGNLRFHANTEKRYEGVIKKEIIEHYLKTGETLDWPSYVKAVGAYLIAKYKYTKEEQFINKNYVLIIDEINRGNISQIFGELITLIEDDKRLGNDEALEVTLPYSKKKFGVPSNLYIIGTMNTADRSVEALDAALRRRFSFVEMPPKPGLIKTDGKTSDGFINEINLVELLQTINKRLEILLDKDHQIGHSYFLCVANLEELKKAFQNKIIPLLQEYFFGDYGKIGLVLGNGFVTIKNNKQEKLFADFSKEYDATEFAERLIYSIENVELMDNEAFTQAIKSLLNN